MIRLVGLMAPQVGAKEITIMVEGPAEYRSGSIDIFDVFTPGVSYQKTQYKDYEHFSGVMGKFEPDFLFLKDPVKMARLSFTKVQKIAENLVAF